LPVRQSPIQAAIVGDRLLALVFHVVSPCDAVQTSVRSLVI
jgi:hypothetical protein